MESQHSRRRKQEKPRQVNNTSDEEEVEPGSTTTATTSVTRDVIVSSKIKSNSDGVSVFSEQLSTPSSSTITLEATNNQTVKQKHNLNTFSNFYSTTLNDNSHGLPSPSNTPIFSGNISHNYFSLLNTNTKTQISLESNETTSDSHTSNTPTSKTTTYKNYETCHATTTSTTCNYAAVSSDEDEDNPCASPQLSNKKPPGTSSPREENNMFIQTLQSYEQLPKVVANTSKNSNNNASNKNISNSIYLMQEDNQSKVSSCSDTFSDKQMERNYLNNSYNNNYDHNEIPNQNTQHAVTSNTLCNDKSINAKNTNYSCNKRNTRQDNGRIETCDNGGGSVGSDGKVTLRHCSREHAEMAGESLNGNEAEDALDASGLEKMEVPDALEMHGDQKQSEVGLQKDSATALSDNNNPHTVFNLIKPSIFPSNAVKQHNIIQQKYELFNPTRQSSEENYLLQEKMTDSTYDSISLYKNSVNNSVKARLLQQHKQQTSFATAQPSDELQQYNYLNNGTLKLQQNTKTHTNQQQPQQQHLQQPQQQPQQQQQLHQRFSQKSKERRTPSPFDDTPDDDVVGTDDDDEDVADEAGADNPKERNGSISNIGGSFEDGGGTEECGSGGVDNGGREDGHEGEYELNKKMMKNDKDGDIENVQQQHQQHQSKLPIIDPKHINMRLMQLQQQQVVQFQVLESIRKKILDNGKSKNGNDDSLVALFMHHQKEIANLYSTYQQTLSFLNRQESSQQLLLHNQQQHQQHQQQQQHQQHQQQQHHFLMYQEYLKGFMNRKRSQERSEDIEDKNEPKILNNFKRIDQVRKDVKIHEEKETEENEEVEDFSVNRHKRHAIDTGTTVSCRIKCQKVEKGSFKQNSFNNESGKSNGDEEANGCYGDGDNSNDANDINLNANNADENTGGGVYRQENVDSVCNHINNGRRVNGGSVFGDEGRGCGDNIDCDDADDVDSEQNFKEEKNNDDGVDKTEEKYEGTVYDLSVRNHSLRHLDQEPKENKIIFPDLLCKNSKETFQQNETTKSPYITSHPNDTAPEQFNSPLMALSSMSSSLKFNTTPINMLFPGDATINAANPFAQFSSYRFNKPTPFFRSAMLNSTSHDDPLEQFMEIQMTQNTKMEELIKEKESKVSDPNECAICHRVLSCRSALQMHYRTHTGERPYKCKLCSRTFTTKGNLKTHMSIHRGKTFQRQLHKCLICNREFSNPLVLQQHFRSHFNDMQKHPAFSLPNVMNPGLFMPASNPFFSYPPSYLALSHHLASKKFDLPRNFLDLANQLKKVEQSEKPKDENSLRPPSQASNIGITSENEDVERNSDEANSPYIEARSDFENDDTTFVSPVCIEPTIKKEAFEFSPTSPKNAYSDKHLNKSCEEISENQIQDRPEIEIKAASSEFYNTLDKDNKEERKEKSHSEPYDFEPFKSDSAQYISPLDALTDRVNALNRFSPSMQQTNSSPQPTDSCPLIKGQNGTQSFTNPNKNLGDHSSDRHRIYAENFIKRITDGKGIGRQLPFPVVSNSKASAACNVCGKLFSCKSAVDIHMRSHTKERPFRCGFCDRAFTTKGNLKQHVGTSHHNLSKYSDSSMSQKSNYFSDSSMSSKSASPCVHAFPSEGNQVSSPKIKKEVQTVKEKLEEAKQKTESKEVNTKKSAMTNNPQTTHKSEKSQEVSKANPHGSRYFCNTCEKPFSSTSALQIHSRTHTGDRPFVCPTCNKAFTTKGNLKVHMGTHAWNKVPSRRGRRMSVDPLASPLNRPYDKQPNSQFPSLPSKPNQPSDLFPYNLLRFPYFQPKLNETSIQNLQKPFHPVLPAFPNTRLPFSHPLHSLFFDKLPVSNLNSFLQEQHKRLMLSNNFNINNNNNNYAANKDAYNSHFLTPIKQEKLDNDSELDLSVKRPVSSSPQSLEDKQQWNSQLRSDRLVFDCR